MSLLPAGLRVERKNSLQEVGAAHRVPPGATGTVTGRTKISSASISKGQELVEVRFDQPCDTRGTKTRKLWFVRPELLIPLEAA